MILLTLKILKINKFVLLTIFFTTSNKQIYNKKTLIVELAGFIHETVDTLIYPHLSRIPHSSLLSSDKDLQIHFVILSDYISNNPSYSFFQLIGNLNKFDEEKYKELFQNIPLLNKKISFKKSTIYLGKYFFIK